MPNTVQHTLHPIVWAVCVGVMLFGASPYVILACAIAAIPAGIYSALPDLYGVWRGSSPGWGFDSSYPASRGDWSGYSEAHHPNQPPGFYEKHIDNLMYKFHLWQDRFSHGDPRYFLPIFEGTPTEIRAKQSFWNDIVNDVLLVSLLWISVGILWTVSIVLAVSFCLYAFKIISWRLHR
jgi:hypothetical protein